MRASFGLLSPRLPPRPALRFLIAAAAVLAVTAPPLLLAVGEPEPVEREYVKAPPAPASQSREDAQAKSAGCMSCHTATDQPSMHASPAVVLGCTDCHGGDATVYGPAGATHAPVGHGGNAPYEGGKEEGAHAGRKYEPGYQDAMDRAHVLPRYPDRWVSSANPVRSYTWLNKESPEFARFINPGDYRAAREACGACHLPIIEAATRSLMANAAMFWGAAAYNNGILSYKHSNLGEAYTTTAACRLRPKPACEITPNMDRARHHGAASTRCPHGKPFRPVTCSASSSAAAATSAHCFPRSAFPASLARSSDSKSPAVRTSGSPRAARAPACACRSRC